MGNITDKRIKIYGERNTGTRYLRRLIENNLRADYLQGELQIGRALRHIPSTRLRELAVDTYFRAGFRTNLGWKHMKVRSVEDLTRNKLVREGRVAFITLTRNPYSWLLSLHRRPYHQGSLRKLDFESFLGSRWQTIGRENAPPVVASPIELWNIKNASYLTLTSLDYLPVRFEDLLASPEDTIKQIGDTFKIGFTQETFQNYDESTKRTGKVTKDYQQYYLEERWMDDLSSRAISIINQGLNHDLVRHYGYEKL